MTWDKIVDEKTSEKHAQTVMDAVSGELKSKKSPNPMKKWIWGLSLGAVPLAAILMFRNTTENLARDAAGGMQAFLDEDAGVLLEGADIVSDLDDLLEDIEVIEELELLEQLGDDPETWEDV